MDKKAKTSLFKKKLQDKKTLNSDRNANIVAPLVPNQISSTASIVTEGARHNSNGHLMSSQNPLANQPTSASQQPQGNKIVNQPPIFASSQVLFLENQLDGLKIRNQLLKEENERLQLQASAVILPSANEALLTSTNNESCSNEYPSTPNAATTSSELLLLNGVVSTSPVPNNAGTDTIKTLRRTISWPTTHHSNLFTPITTTRHQQNATASSSDESLIYIHGPASASKFSSTLSLPQLNVNDLESDLIDGSAANPEESGTASSEVANKSLGARLKARHGKPVENNLKYGTSLLFVGSFTETEGQRHMFENELVDPVTRNLVVPQCNSYPFINAPDIADFTNTLSCYISSSASSSEDDGFILDEEYLLSRGIITRTSDNEQDTEYSDTEESEELEVDGDGEGEQEQEDEENAGEEAESDDDEVQEIQQIGNGEAVPPPLVVVRARDSLEAIAGSIPDTPPQVELLEGINLTGVTDDHGFHPIIRFIRRAIAPTRYQMRLPELNFFYELAYYHPNEPQPTTTSKATESAIGGASTSTAPDENFVETSIENDVVNSIIEKFFQSIPFSTYSAEDAVATAGTYTPPSPFNTEDTETISSAPFALRRVPPNMQLNVRPNAIMNIPSSGFMNGRRVRSPLYSAIRAEVFLNVYVPIIFRYESRSTATNNVLGILLPGDPNSSWSENSLLGYEYAFEPFLGQQSAHEESDESEREEEGDEVQEGEEIGADGFTPEQGRVVHLNENEFYQPLRVQWMMTDFVNEDADDENESGTEYDNDPDYDPDNVLPENLFPGGLPHHLLIPFNRVLLNSSSSSSSSSSTSAGGDADESNVSSTVSVQQQQTGSTTSSNNNSSDVDEENGSISAPNVSANPEPTVRSNASDLTSATEAVASTSKPKSKFPEKYCKIKPRPYDGHRYVVSSFGWIKRKVAQTAQPEWLPRYSHRLQSILAQYLQTRETTTSNIGIMTNMSSTSSNQDNTSSNNLTTSKREKSKTPDSAYDHHHEHRRTLLVRPTSTDGIIINCQLLTKNIPGRLPPAPSNRKSDMNAGGIVSNDNNSVDDNANPNTVSSRNPEVSQLPQLISCPGLYQHIQASSVPNQFGMDNSHGEHQESVTTEGILSGVDDSSSAEGNNAIKCKKKKRCSSLSRILCFNYCTSNHKKST